MAKRSTNAGENGAARNLGRPWVGDDVFPRAYRVTAKRLKDVRRVRENEPGRRRGFFVAFSFTADAEREAAAFHKRTGRVIKLISVQEILDEQHVQKM